MAPQTEEVYKRKHAYRTEVFQIQDYFIKEKRHVNQALVGHAAVAIMQSTAARVGMFTKTRHDGKTVRWRKENPLRVRDIVHEVRKLVLKAKQGSTVSGSRYSGYSLYQPLVHIRWIQCELSEMSQSQC